MVEHMTSRIVVTVAWVGIIFGFLFIPTFTDHLKKEALNVALWSGVYDPKVFKEFEKQTGIAVNLTYYGGNEELMVKLLATKAQGYDLIMPSDYAVEFLASKNLLKKLDKSRLNFFDDLNPKLIGHAFDPQNDYSLPADWYIMGIGINKKYFNNRVPRPSWNLLFDPKTMPNHVGLIDDSRELISLLIWYRYGQIRPINVHEVDEITTLLLAQKRKVEAYTDFRGDFLLLSGNCAAVMVGHSYVWRKLGENPDLVYLIPEEGTFIGLENFAIPAGSRKEAQVYELLNFLCSAKVQKQCVQNCTLSPVRADAHYFFDEPALASVIPFIHPQSPERALPFANFLTDEQVNTIWLRVKGA